MENFSQSSLALQRVAADVASSGRAIEHLKEQKAGARRRRHLPKCGPGKHKGGQVEHITERGSGICLSCHLGTPWPATSFQHAMQLQPSHQELLLFPCVADPAQAFEP